MGAYTLDRAARKRKAWDSEEPHQSHQVPGVFAAEVSAAAECDQGHEEDGVGHVVRPRVVAHKRLGVLHEGEDGDEGEGDQQLHGQDHEHLGGGGERSTERVRESCCIPFI